MVISVRRTLVERARREPPTSCNAGLWLDRYLARGYEGSDADKQAKREHLERALAIACPPGYGDFVASRRRLFEGTPGTRVFRARARGRLLTGVGRATPWENGIALHHTWGVPVIPGSGLKGLAATFAHHALEGDGWRRGEELHAYLFGTTEEQGAVVFHDALWEPGSGHGDLGLALDTITVHHPDYYQGRDAPPADWDAPTPVPLLSASGRFVFALEARPDVDEAWLDTARQVLEAALEISGVGAKTFSGYGRMALDELESEARREARLEREALERARENLVRDVNLFLEHRDGGFDSLLKRVGGAAVEKEERERLASELVDWAVKRSSKPAKKAHERLEKALRDSEADPSAWPYGAELRGLVASRLAQSRGPAKPESDWTDETVAQVAAQAPEQVDEAALDELVRDAVDRYGGPSNKVRKALQKAIAGRYTTSADKAEAERIVKSACQSGQG